MAPTVFGPKYNIRDIILKFVIKNIIIGIKIDSYLVRRLVPRKLHFLKAISKF